MYFNKRGITLIELLGSLVLLGILVGLITTTVSIFIRTSSETLTETQIQSEGLLIVRTIESRINNLGPNSIDEDGCVSVNAPTECIMLIREVDGVQSSLELYLFEGNIFVGDNPIVVRNLIVTSFDVVHEIVNDNVILTTTIKLTLDPSDGRTFTFRSSNLFRLE